MTKRLNYKFVLAFCFVAFGLMVSHVQAQQANIDAGVAYLRATQNPDGSWGGTETSLNTVLQTTATTARTFQLLGISDTTLSNALTFLSSQSTSALDDMAHQIEVLVGSGA